jgi:hypothetical protein
VRISISKEFPLYVIVLVLSPVRVLRVPAAITTAITFVVVSLVTDAPVMAVAQEAATISVNPSCQYAPEFIESVADA